MVLEMPETAVGPFLFMSLQMANFFAGAFAVALGVSLLAREAQTRYATGRGTEPYHVEAVVMGFGLVFAGAIGSFAFWPRLVDTFFYWLAFDQHHQVSALTAMFALYIATAIAVGIATRRPRRTIMLWMIFFACGIGETLFRLALTQPTP